MTTIFIGLVNNAALLLSLGLLYDMLGQRRRQGKALSQQLLTGLILGAIGIAIMLNPWSFGQGVLFDTRSVLLCIAGFFFGAVPTAIAVALTGAFRLYTGGSGVFAGVGVIITSAAIGLGWRYLRRHRNDHPSLGELYLLGIVVHLAMLAWMLSLPRTMVYEVLAKITLPVICIYPLATALLGKLMISRQTQLESEKALAKREHYLRTILLTTADGFWIVDRQGFLTDVNVAYCALSGYTRDELVGMSVGEIDARESAWEITARIARVIADGPEIFQTVHRRKDGSEFPVEISLTYLGEDEGKFVCFLRDLTVRQQQDNRVALLGRMLDAAPAAVMVHAPDGRMLFANEATLAMHGYPEKEEFLKVNLRDLDVPESAALLDQRFQQIAEHGEARFEVGHFRRNGSSFPMEIHVKAIEWEGQPAFLSVGVDITERKSAEEAIAHSSALLRYIVEHANSAVAVHDRELRYVYVSQRYLERYRVKEQEVIGRHHYEVFPDLPEKWREVHGKALMGEITSSERDPYPREDGTVDWTRWECRPWYQVDGSIGGLIVYTEVITERILAEEALRKSEEYLRAVISSSPLAIISYTIDGLVLSWNEAAEQIFGWSEAEVLGRFVPSVPENEHAEFAHLRQIVAAGGSYPQVEVVRQKRDGTPLPIRLSIAPIRDRDGQVTAIMSIIEDITQRRQAEAERDLLQAQLIQAQKMESVGRLAGGVAHDYNNMLSVILGYTEMALEKVSREESLHDNLEEVLKAANRSIDLTRQLLAFSRQQTIAPRVLDLNDTVSGMLKMIKRLIGEDIELLWHPGAEVWPVYMDPTQLDQILVNLCVNARDAISDVGKISIETGTRVFDEAYCAAHYGFVPGDFVLLAVSDDGCGMDSLTRNKIFEPFFTTKEQGKGTGLGLSTVYGIVKQNNGFLNVYSEPGDGTTFSLYLPRSRAVEDNRPTPAPESLEIRGNETLLLVEDEQAILKMTTLMLEYLGYAVLVARTPDEAIKLAADYTGRIDLLITDVVMPGMNGRELAGRLDQRFPGLKTLFMSGYTANVIADRGVLKEGVNFIQKPFSQKSLSKKIREILDRAGSGGGA
jgi:PAS domain S-box-containing protein